MDFSILSEQTKSNDNFDSNYSHGEFYQSISNSNSSNEHNELVIAEDYCSSGKQIPSFKVAEDQDPEEPNFVGQVISGVNFNNDYSHGNRSIINYFLQHGNNLESQTTSQDSTELEKKLEQTSPHSVQVNCRELDFIPIFERGLKSTDVILENQSRRKRGRPRKIFQFEEEPKEKRPRGRPRKTFIEKVEPKVKKPVGRPRIYFEVKSKEKRPRGRPRKYFDKIKNEMKEKRPRGRPKKYFYNTIKEKRARGRPRIHLKLTSLANETHENTSVLRKRGRPRKVLQSTKATLSPILQLSVSKDFPSSGDYSNDVESSASGNVSPSHNQTLPRRIFQFSNLSKLDDTSSVEGDSMKKTDDNNLISDSKD